MPAGCEFNDNQRIPSVDSEPEIPVGVGSQPRCQQRQHKEVRQNKRQFERHCSGQQACSEPEDELRQRRIHGWNFRSRHDDPAWIAQVGQPGIVRRQGIRVPARLLDAAVPAITLNVGGKCGRERVKCQAKNHRAGYHNPKCRAAF